LTSDFSAEAADSSVVVELQQSVRDLEGKPLQHQAHGLKDKTVMQVFLLQDGKVTPSTFRTLPETERMPEIQELCTGRLLDIG
jgi:phosphoribosylformylglycinamidine (FGAM) synthase PurS component